MARTPKTPASAVCGTLTPRVRVEKSNPLAMGRITTTFKAVPDKALLPIDAAVRQTLAAIESTDGCLLIPDKKTIHYPDANAKLSDLSWKSTQSDISQKSKQNQLDKKLKDAQSSTAGQPKRGRPKLTNGRRGG